METFANIKNIGLDIIKLYNEIKRIKKENIKLKISNDKLTNFKSIVIGDKFYNTLTEKQIEILMRDN